MIKRFTRPLCLFLSCILFILSAAGCAGKQENSSSSNSTSQPVDLGELTVTVFQTGKSDCILIETPDGTALIDTAEKGDGDELAEELIQRGIQRLDLLLLTHLDKDHIGGAAKILEKISVDRLIQADYDEDSSQYEKYQEACDQAGLTPTRLAEEITLSLGGASLTLIPGANPPYQEDNDYSIITVMTYGDIRFLFAGDAEEKRLGEFLDTDPQPVDFLKVPHHGRYNDLSAAFLDALHPRWAVITCSEKNPPEEKLLQALQAVNAEVLLTAQGDVTAVTDGKTLAVTQG